MDLSSAMRVPALRRALLAFGVPILVILVTKVVAGKEVRGRVHSLFTEPPPPPAELVNVPVAVPRDHVVVLDDSLFGRSGKVRVKMLRGLDAERIDGLKDVFGVKALGTTARRPPPDVSGVRDAPVTIGGATFRPGDWVYADGDAVLVASRRLHGD